MSFADACQQLADWLEESLGNRIALPSGDQKGLRLTADYQPEEIAEIVADWKTAVPADYLEFLQTVGACEVFYGGTGKGRGLSFTRIESLREFYHEYFEKAGPQLLEPYLPVTCDYARHLIGVFDLSRPDGANFALVPDELQAPDWPDWVDSHGGWGSFREWMIQLVASEGEFPDDAA